MIVHSKQRLPMHAQMIHPSLVCTPFKSKEKIRDLLDTGIFFMKSWTAEHHACHQKNFSLKNYFTIFVMHGAEQPKIS